MVLSFQLETCARLSALPMGPVPPGTHARIIDRPFAVKACLAGSLDVGASSGQARIWSASPVTGPPTLSTTTATPLPCVIRQTPSPLCPGLPVRVHCPRDRCHLDHPGAM